MPQVLPRAHEQDERPCVAVLQTFLRLPALSPARAAHARKKVQDGAKSKAGLRSHPEEKLSSPGPLSGAIDEPLFRMERHATTPRRQMTLSTDNSGIAEGSAVTAFAAPYAPPDEVIAAELLDQAPRSAAAERRIDAYTAHLIEGIRARTGGLGGIEDFLHAYSLTTKEGLALMVLAEALLRVPDAATADRLIEDKLAGGHWLDGDVKSTALLVSASAWTLGVAARIIHPGETPETILDSLGRRLGLPALRAATRGAMRLLGSHFVLGQNIEEALARAGSHPEFSYSFDMLGEGARTAADADKYFAAYAGAINAIGASTGPSAPRPGISVKLTALHPRFEAISRTRVLREAAPRLLELARL